MKLKNYLFAYTLISVAAGFSSRKKESTRTSEKPATTFAPGREAGTGEITDADGNTPKTILLR